MKMKDKWGPEKEGGGSENVSSQICGAAKSSRS